MGGRGSTNMPLLRSYKSPVWGMEQVVGRRGSTEMPLPTELSEQRKPSSAGHKEIQSNKWPSPGGGEIFVGIARPKAIPELR